MSTPGSVDILLTIATNAVLGPLMGAAFITKASVLNLSGATVTVTLFRVATGIAVTTTNYAMVRNQQIPPGPPFVLPLSGHALAVGSAIYAKCSATNAANFNASYVIP